MSKFKKGDHVKTIKNAQPIPDNEYGVVGRDQVEGSTRVSVTFVNSFGWGKTASYRSWSINSECLEHAPEYNSPLWKALS